jgi:hypothetical protein
MPRSIIECNIPVTARLKNCDGSSLQIIYDRLKYALKFICFTYKIISIIYRDIHAFQSLVPHKVDPPNEHSASQWNGKRKFFENTNSIVGSGPQQRIQNNNILRDYNWTSQMDNKNISLDPATCSLTPSPARPRPQILASDACFASVRRFSLSDAGQNSLK